MEERRYKLRNIREFLLRGFEGPELRRLCSDTPELQPVLDELKKDASKAELVDALLDFAERRKEMEVLLVRARERNPWQYQQHRPYYEGEVDLQPEQGLTQGDEGIPAPAPLPPGSRMPLGHNPLFVGREDDLRALARVLRGGQTAAIGQMVGVTGLGGIGKTQLASEFAHRYGQYFAGGVFWLSFDNPEGVKAQVAACGGPGALGLWTDSGSLPLEDQVRLVQAAWHSPLPRLLVFDNCEDEALLAQWRPTTGGCRVLVTSRRANWDPGLGVEVRPLGVLPRLESIELLRKFRPDLGADDPDLDAIAEELGDLPLALHLAGSFLRQYRREVTSAEYLAELKGAALLAHESLQGLDLTVSPTNHDLHAGRTFALSYDKLKPEEPIDSLALALLSRAAYFAPGEPIPWDLLLATVELPDKAAQRWAGRAMKRLMGLGLLDEEKEGAVVMHRLVAAFGRGVAEAGAQGAVEQGLMAYVSKRTDQAGYIGQLLAVQSHLRVVTDGAREREDEQAANLCVWLGYYLNQIGAYPAARSYLERALAIREKGLGPEHPDTANSLNNLGYLLQDLGDLAGARPYLERALAICEQVLGPEHPDTAISLNNLGLLLKDLGDRAGARLYLERALAIREQGLGPEHPATALNLNNLGLLLQALGDLAGARPYLERALAIRGKVLGPEHPDTAKSLNNLGSLLQALGDLAGARPYLERALAIRGKVLGPDHPDTAQSLNNLGNLLQALGDLAGARSYHERALAIREKALGPEHPATAQSIWWIGTLLAQGDDREGARRHLERAVAIYSRALGVAHPTTQQCQQMLNELGGEANQ